MSFINLEIGRRVTTVDKNFEVSDKTETAVEVIRVIGPAAIAAGKNGQLRGRMVQTRDETITLVPRLFQSTSSETPQIVVFSAVDPGREWSCVCAGLAEMLVAR